MRVQRIALLLVMVILVIITLHIIKIPISYRLDKMSYKTFPATRLLPSDGYVRDCVSLNTVGNISNKVKLKPFSKPIVNSTTEESAKEREESFKNIYKMHSWGKSKPEDARVVKGLHRKQWPLYIYSSMKSNGHMVRK